MRCDALATDVLRLQRQWAGVAVCGVSYSTLTIRMRRCAIRRDSQSLRYGAESLRHGAESLRHGAESLRHDAESQLVFIERIEESFSRVRTAGFPTHIFETRICER